MKKSVTLLLLLYYYLLLFIFLIHFSVLTIYIFTRYPTHPRTGKTSPFLQFLRIAACFCLYVCISMFVYVCLCVCMCVYVCLYVWVWLMYMCLYVYQMCVCSVCLDAPPFLRRERPALSYHLYSSMYVLVCVHMCLYVWVWLLYVCMCVCSVCLSASCLLMPLWLRHKECLLRVPVAPPTGLFG